MMIRWKKRTKKQNKSKFILNILIMPSIFLIIILGINSGKAEISLSPLLIEVDESRGQAQNVITITNTSNEVFKARIYAEPFTYNTDSGLEVLKSHPSDLRPYLHFTPNQVTIPPSGVRRVRLNVSLSPKIPDGEYRAMIFTEPIKDVYQSTSNTTIVTRIGSAFYVRKGEVKPLLSIESATWNILRKQVQITVNNNGKSSAFSTIRWTLKKGDKVVAKGETSSNTIISEGQRNIVLSISPDEQKLINPGDYQLSGQMISSNSYIKSLPFSLGVSIPPLTNSP